MRNKYIRMLRYSCLLFVIVFGLIAIIGTGGGGGGGDDTTTTTATTTTTTTTLPPSSTTYKGSDYYPLNVGNTWVYNLGTVEVDEETITINGVTYQAVKSTVVSCDEGGDSDIAITYSEEGVVGLVPDALGDLLILLPKEMKAGDSWVTLFDEGVKLTHTFEGLEDITVPAGTFSDCLKIKVDLDDDYTDILWFAKNVGLVKAKRISETTPDGCFLYVSSENPLAELQSATIDGVSYP